MTERAQTRPVKRIAPYYGAKWRIAQWMIARFPAHRTFVDAFGGSGAVVLSKQPSRQDVYNDIDDEVVNLFRVLRDSPGDLEVAVLLTPYSRKEHQLALADVGGTDVERARRWLVRAWQTRGGPQRTGFRVSRLAREGSTPSRQWRLVPSRIAAVADRMRSVVIENDDWVNVVRRYDGPECLHYLDPPYPFITRSRREQIYTHEMSDTDHEAMLEVAVGLKGRVAVSGYRCPLYDDALGDWVRHDRPARNGRAGACVESLWIRA